MALIHCPECNGQVSDRAPVCPHCGFPFGEAAAASATAVAAVGANAPATEVEASAGDAAPAAPDRFAHRQGFWERIPIAFLLFWGGMVIGVMGSPVTRNITKGGVEAAERTPLGWIGWIMMATGVVWFLFNLAAHFMRNQRADNS